MTKNNKSAVKIFAISLIIALSVVICGMAMTVSASDSDRNYYYIDSINGDDSNSGRLDSPYKTIEKTEKYGGRKLQNKKNKSRIKSQTSLTQSRRRFSL